MTEKERLIIRDERTPFQKSLELARDNAARVTSSLPGITIAGMVFPTTAGAFLLVIALLNVPEQFPGMLDGLAALGSVLMYMIVGGMLGAIVAFFSGLIASLFLLLFNWTIGNLFSPRLLVGMAGGLGGYLPFASLIFYELRFEHLGDLDLLNLLAGLFVVWAAVLHGTLGMTWFYKKHSQYKNRMKPEFETQYQFRIQQLMAVTMWVGLIFALAPLASELLATSGTRIAGFELVLMILFWIPLQLSCLMVPYLFGLVEPGFGGPKLDESKLDDSRRAESFGKIEIRD